MLGAHRCGTFPQSRAPEMSCCAVLCGVCACRHCRSVRAERQSGCRHCRLGLPCQRVTKYAPTSLALAQRGGSHCVAHRSTIARLPSGAAAKRSAASAQGRSAGGRVLRHVGTFAVSAPLRSSLRHRESPCIPCAAFIRECGLHGLVGIPPVTLQGRLAAPAAPGRRIRFGPAPPLRHLAR